MHAEEVVVGPNFRFGYERKENADTLRKLGKQYGFTVKVVPVVCDEEGEISSSRIRNHLAKGEMEKVNELLGYDFFVTREIVHGNHIGRTLGRADDEHHPGEGRSFCRPNGVYASETRIGKRIYQGLDRHRNQADGRRTVRRRRDVPF
jgi:riboflavin kinase/FMN adenylyltransferase